MEVGCRESFCVSHQPRCSPAVRPTRNPLRNRSMLGAAAWRLGVQDVASPGLLRPAELEEVCLPVLVDPSHCCAQADHERISRLHVDGLRHRQACPEFSSHGSSPRSAATRIISAMVWRDGAAPSDLTTSSLISSRVYPARKNP